MSLDRKNEALQVYKKLLTLDKKKAQELYAEINKPKQRVVALIMAGGRQPHFRGILHGDNSEIC